MKFNFLKFAETSEEEKRRSRMFNRLFWVIFLSIVLYIVIFEKDGLNEYAQRINPVLSNELFAQEETIDDEADDIAPTKSNNPRMVEAVDVNKDYSTLLKTYFLRVGDVYSSVAYEYDKSTSKITNFDEATKFVSEDIKKDIVEKSPFIKEVNGKQYIETNVKSKWGKNVRTKNIVDTETTLSCTIVVDVYEGNTLVNKNVEIPFELEKQADGSYRVTKYEYVFK
ncbi:MAG: hypothetical protein IKN74_03295 [Clostridia bacterium]|nr:hypothetical protein [Clostridia bacterium]